MQTEEPPALLAFREEGSTKWQSVAVAGRSTFTITAAGPYRVVVTCENLGGVIQVIQYARTLDDEPLIKLVCNTTPGSFTVRGTMMQPGKISLGYDTRSGTDPNWGFELPSSPGSFDLVMLSEDARIAIRRDVQITSDQQLGVLDLALEAPQMRVPIAFTATNLLPTESRSSQVILEAGGTLASLHYGPGWDFDLAPRSVLQPTDHQTVIINASEPPSTANPVSRTRSVVRDFGVGDSTTVTLLEPLDMIAFENSPDRLVATWSALPEYDALILTRSSYASPTRSWSHSITLTRAFVEATGATSATLDLSDIPSFKSQWRQDPSLAQEHQFTTRRVPSDFDLATSSIIEYLEPSQVAGHRSEPAWLLEGSERR